MGAFSGDLSPGRHPHAAAACQKAGAVLASMDAGNLGIAFAALLTGFLVKHWAGARRLPCQACCRSRLVCLYMAGATRGRVARRQTRRQIAVACRSRHGGPVFAVLTCTTTLAALFSTSPPTATVSCCANALPSSPATLPARIVAGRVYAIASLARSSSAPDRPLSDQTRLPAHRGAQVVCFLLAARADGWWFTPLRWPT